MSDDSIHQYSEKLYTMNNSVSVLAKIINGGTLNVAAVNFSNNLLSSYGDIETVLKASLPQLQKIAGFKPQHWHNLLAYQQQQLLPLRRALKGRPLSADMFEVIQYCHQLFAFVHGGLRAIFLDAKNHYINDLFIAVGEHKIDYNMYIRDFYLAALEWKSYGIILASNQFQAPCFTPYFFENHHKLHHDLSLIDIDLLGVIDVQNQKVNL